MPRQRARQQAAEQHAEAASAGAHEAVDAHRLRPVPGFGEDVHDERQRDGGDHGAAEALQRARGNEDRLRAGDSADQRRRGKERDAGEEQPALAVEVAEPPAEQEEPAVGEHVGVDHPHQRAVGEAEAALDRRQRDVHDRGVEHDHELARAQHVQGEPSLAFFDQSALQRFAFYRSTTTLKPPKKMRFMSKGMSLLAMIFATRASFIAFLFTRSRCARFL